ncbi:ABC transporter permease [Ancylobacter gelatini]|uniref:ABC transporter permease n=1 Tax=Ancylobacter gelatini TaxID=2919920 RepID=UPI003CC96523
MHGTFGETADAETAIIPEMKHHSYSRVVLGRFMRQPVAMTAAGILLVIILAAIFANYVAPADPFQTRVARRLAEIGTPDRWLGGDELGRDLLSRLIYGGRISLSMAVLPVAVGLFVGGLLGILAGYAGGRTNMAIMRAMDVFYAFPSILLAVAIAGALGPGLMNAVLALSMVFIPPIARMAESVTTQVRSYEFVIAARLSGASTARIMREHVLSNVAGPILVFASSQVSVSIIAASGLSFLGLGVAPPNPDWGLMLSALRQSIYVNPWVAALPGAMIFICSVCFNLVSDGVRRAMEVRR